MPEIRTLSMCTSSFRISHEPDFVWYLGLVIDGQMLEGAPWDRSVEAYENEGRS